MLEIDSEGLMRISLRDLTHLDMPQEFADMAVEELPVKDVSTVRPGTVFYWTIGEERLRGGTIQKTSEIRMKRLPRYSARKTVQDRKAAAEMAEFMQQVLGDGSSGR
ncbi:hypothetical protein [Botrimarina mediterranea]|uniref:hypothetical protein n=1 Tax=Botrimarina mediterranea TaxID=2528022 RepID=UPI0011A1E936